ncbi:MAG: 23S rRNA (adenine(2503)-C(2))-methyltransferase RlmN [Bacteroidetes bacterium]|nr:MAG: 23S rRNA (adenine(2503)-C(2))-methyltransferase RlmN [Bacteroidota bacterium]
MQQKEYLFGKTLNELKEVCKELALPGFTAKQIADWLYKKDINTIDEMSNLSKKARLMLNDRYEFGTSSSVSVQESKDGTKKYLFKTPAGKYIEAAYIPEKNRNTLCVSSQVGCKMACTFCMTGRQKFHGDLSAGSIVNQVRSLPEWHNISNIVYMGMGEPMDNLDEVLKSLEILTSDWGMAMSPRRINVSTIGVIPSVKRFLDESQAHLAISMHSPFEEERAELMPVQKAYPLEDILELVKQYDWNGQRRVSFEYIIFDGLNHSAKHVAELSRLLSGMKCRINLIRFHQIPDSKLKSSNDAEVEKFMDQLNAKGIRTTIRASRGQDIDAACGLLSTKKMLETNEN